MEKIKNKLIEEIFKKSFDWIDAWTLDDILEWLQDYEYLNKKGLEFRHRFWEKYIKEK